MTHVPAGRLNGIRAEPGTVLGPKTVTHDYVTVTANDEQGLTVGYARGSDVDLEAIEAMAERGPRSVTEHHMVAGYQTIERHRLRRLFVGDGSSVRAAE